MAIDLQQLCKKFGDKTAVNQIDLSIPDGACFGFLGPNGAGKTTTIRMITGLLAPTSGDALIDGVSITKDPVAVKRMIGVVPDTLALFDRLSLWEHLTMIGPIYGLSDEDTTARAEDLLRLLGLWDDRGTFAAEASTGMRKKLALAIAMIHNPRILFLDEPFEGVDPLAAKVIRDLLRTLSARGTTIFITSHILEVVERLVDQVAIIVDGQIAAQTSLKDLAAEGRSLEDAFIDAAGSSDAETVELTWLRQQANPEAGE